MARSWAQSGVTDYANKLEVYGDSSGRQVKVKTGRACVRGHWYENTAEETVAIAANASGNPRIDRVVLRLDPSANSIVLAVVQGTPAGSPSAPSLTQTDVGTYELTLAKVAVANGASTITAGNVTDERAFTGTVPYCRAWHTGYPSQTASVSVQKYNDADHSDAALVPVDGVFTLNRSGIWLLNGYALQETTTCAWGFQSSRFTYSPLYLLTRSDGGYANVTLAHNFTAGDTVSFVCQKSGTPTVFRPAMSVTYLGAATIS